MPLNRIVQAVLLAPVLAAAAGTPPVSPGSRQSDPASPAASVVSKAQALFSAIVRHHGSYRDFEARFTETSVSRATGAATPETGVVFYRRPGRWRWEYSSPERKRVVVRDKVVVISIEGEEDISRYELGDDDGGAGIGLLLSGGERVETAFLARFEPPGLDAQAEMATLRLEPVEMSEQYDHILLRVRRSD